MFSPLCALKDTTSRHVLTSRVYDPSLAWRDPAEGDKQRAHPFVMFLSMSVLLQLLMNEEHSEDTFTLSPSRLAISQLKHVEVTWDGFVTQGWARSSHTGWALNYADQGWIWEMSTVHDGGYSLQKSKTEDRRRSLPRTVTDFDCCKFWQMLFVFRWHHDAQGFSVRWLIMFSDVDSEDKSSLAHTSKKSVFMKHLIWVW